MDVREIDREIKKLEVADMTYSNVQQLALLYMVRNNLEKEEKTAEPEKMAKKEYSYAAPPKATEFRAAALKAPFDGLINVLSEHFESIRRTYPKEYSMVVDKLNDLI